MRTVTLLLKDNAAEKQLSTWLAQLEGVRMEHQPDSTPSEHAHDTIHLAHETCPRNDVQHEPQMASRHMEIYDWSGQEIIG
jgi:hypothetical protein